MKFERAVAYKKCAEVLPFHINTEYLNLLGGLMKEILDQMEEQIAIIRNLQRSFDFHSKILEKLMISLNNWYLENNREGNIETPGKRITATLQDGST